MKQTATNSMDHFRRNIKALGLCLMLAAGSITASNAQSIIRPFHNGYVKEESISNERNPSTSPIRNNPPASLICPAISSITMVDMGFDKALVEWDNTLNFETIMFRVTDMSSHGTNIITIDGSPNPGRYFIQGLNPLTSYEIEISTVCVDGTQSSWSTPITVTTLQPRFSIGNNDSQQRNVNRLHVTPNPASTTTIISFLVAGRGQQNITITSTSGHEVFKTSVFPSVDKIEMHVDVSNYPTGVYIVKVSNSAGVSVERLIVQ
jgi:hypothetical protein